MNLNAGKKVALLLFVSMFVIISGCSDVDFGTDTSQWAKDGECDDPRFVDVPGERPGMANLLAEEDYMRDATDCQSLYEQGRITLR